jgi:hypothetical protein
MSNQQLDRPLNAQEHRFYLVPNAHISLVARLKGKIAEEPFRKAVKKVVATYPHLETSIVSKEGELWFDSKNAANTAIKSVTRENDDTWFEAIDGEHKIPVRLSEGPLARFVLVSDKEMTEIIIFVHHALVDGMSLYYVLRDLLTFVNEPHRPVEAKPIPPAVTEEMMPDHLSLGRIKKWLLGRLNKKWADEKVNFDEGDALRLHELFWKKYDYKAHLLLLDEEQTTKFIKACRNHGVTVNSALCTLFMKARIKIIGDYKDEKARLVFAVDARERLKIHIGENVGFYAGGVELDYKYPNKPFWGLTKDFHETATKELTNNAIFEPVLYQYLMDPTLMDAVAIYGFAKILGITEEESQKIGGYLKNNDHLARKVFEKRMDDIPDLILTNLTRLKLPQRVNGAELERVFFTPSSGMKAELVIGACDAAGKLSVSVNYMEPSQDGPTLERIRNQSMQILEAEVGF